VLIGVNVLVYIIMQLSGGYRSPLIPYLAMNPRIVTNFGWVWQFVTYMFVHDPHSIMHLVFNMFALLIFGQQVEHQMGSREFLLYYFLTGILAGIFSFFVYLFTGSMVFLMGASGALFAIQLAFAVFFPRRIIYIWGILPLQANILVLGVTGIQIISMLSARGSNVAHITHLAGFAFGWLYFMMRFGIDPWKAMRR